MSDVLVSVIIPVFNVKPYLDEAIESVIAQTYKHLEILIINDGSTDGSGKICDHYREKDSRISVIHQENRGLSAARNIGLVHSTGDLIAFLDPDDVFVSDAIEVMLKELVEHKADIVICDFTTVKSEGRLPSPKQRIYRASATFNKQEILKKSFAEMSMLQYGTNCMCVVFGVG